MSTCRCSTPPLAHFVGYENVGLCVHARTCGQALALSTTATSTPCDHYVEPDYKIGNLADGRSLLEIVDSAPQQAFGQAKLTTLPKYCRECDVRFACNGGCPKDRFLTTPTASLACTTCVRVSGVLPPRGQNPCG